MAFPAQATVQATHNFVRQVRLVYAHWEAQPMLAGRTESLQAAFVIQLERVRNQLRQHPASGRPARFLQSTSGRSAALAMKAQAQAQSLGVPQLREWVMAPYLVLYAHSDERVVLLALKHQREMEFSVD